MSIALHDGSTLVLRKADDGYDPSDRSAAMKYLETHSSRGEVVTGLMFIDESLPEMHAISETAAKPLTNTEFEALNPGSEALKNLQKHIR